MAFARVHLGEVPDGEQLPLVGLEQAFLESLEPGTTVTRYGRTWHMAQWERQDDIVTGHIGFDVHESAIWNEEVKDFLSVKPAQIAAFAVDLERLRIAFQLRGKAIRPWTFQGNFEALLNAAPTPYDWTVRLEGVDQPPWEEWVEEVDRVTEVTATLVRPNPHYDFQDIEHLFEEGELAEATIGGKGDSINPGAGLLDAAIGHVLNGYGRLRAKAIKVRGGQRHTENWRSTADQSIRQVQVPLNPETGELDPDDLRNAVAEAPEPEGEDEATTP